MRHIIYTLVAISIFSAVALADEISFAVSRAEVICTPGTTPSASRIEFAIDKSLNAEELIEATDEKSLENRKKLREWIIGTLRDPSNYRLMQVESGDTAILTVPLKSPTRAQVLDNTVVFIVSNYEVSKGYVLFAKNLNWGGKGLPFVVKAAENSNCEGRPTKLPDADKPPDPKDPKAPSFKDYFAKAAIEGSPKLKVDFSMQGSKKKRVLSSFNVNFRPYTQRGLRFGGQYEIAYFFVDTEYKINASGDDKKNVLNIGIFDTKLTKVFRDDGDEPNNFFYRRVPAVVLSITPKLETEWEFKERNLVAGPRATLPINFYQSRSATIRVDPFIGIEAGVTWASVISKPGKILLRPLTGFGITASFLRKNDKPLFGLQIDYIRRFFLRPEYSFGPDASGTLVRDRETKRPRDHAKARFFVNATDLFAPFIEYEYGRVPPQYNFINHSFKTGIAFNVDVVWDKFN